MMAPGLRVRGLTKSFGAARALDGVDLAVPMGQVHAPLALIKCLGGAHPPDADTIEVGGTSYTPLTTHGMRTAVRALAPQLFPLPLSGFGTGVAWHGGSRSAGIAAAPVVIAAVVPVRGTAPVAGAALAYLAPRVGR